MTGYQEIFTDPSYFGQVIIMTNDHIGNYGVKNTDVESSSVKIAGLICKNISRRYSRMVADGSLEEYLIANNLVSIYDVDTRALVQHVRSKGAMNCIISTELTDEESLKAELAKVPSMDGLELSSQVSTASVYTLGNPDAECRIAVLDYGVKKNILNCLVERGAYVKVFPAKTEIEELKAFDPHGYFISNGPGDPAALPGIAAEVRRLAEAGTVPIFGICLGHQILATALGATTYKLPFGHHGGNHPVRRTATGAVEITSQNHNYAVAADSLGASEVTHVNLNDGVIEGLAATGTPAFSVQYHPEAGPGPHDARYLFEEFRMRMDATGARPGGSR